MQYNGTLLKMETKLKNVVEYELPIGDDLVFMNHLIGKYIIFKWKKEIYCIGCGRKTNKSFAQGFCYPCFLNSPSTSDCIIKPERCNAHNINKNSQCKDRNAEWAENNHNQPTYVYLAI